MRNYQRLHAPELLDGLLGLSVSDDNSFRDITIKTTATSAKPLDPIAKSSNDIANSHRETKTLGDRKWKRFRNRNVL